MNLIQKLRIERIQALIDIIVRVFGSPTKAAEHIGVFPVAVIRLQSNGAFPAEFRSKLVEFLHLEGEEVLELYLSGELNISQLLYRARHTENYLDNLLIESVIDSFYGFSEENKKKLCLGIDKVRYNFFEPDEDPYEKFPPINFLDVFPNIEVAKHVAQNLKTLTEQTSIFFGNAINGFVDRGTERSIVDEILCLEVDDLIAITWDWKIFYSLAKILPLIDHWDEIPKLDLEATYRNDPDSLLIDLSENMDFVSKTASLINYSIKKSKISQKDINRRLKEVELSLNEWRKIRFGIKVPSVDRVDIIRYICWDLTEIHFTRSDWLGSFRQEKQNIIQS